MAWNLYAASYNNPAREYGRRNHPADIRSTYLGRRDHIATAWHELQQQGQFPPQADFDETFNRVDRHITELRDTWANSLPPGELHRLRQQHIQQQQSRHDPRRGRGGPVAVILPVDTSPPAWIQERPAHRGKAAALRGPMRTVLLVCIRPIEAPFVHLRLDELTARRGKLPLGGCRRVDF